MERLIAVVGPTAVGKSNLSIELAKGLHTQIISGDSMLVYQGFDIGSAKPGIEERSSVVHHLIDILKPTEEFSVALFQRLARELVTQINKSGRIPILAGGTGLYVKSLLEGYKFNRTKGNWRLRRELEAIAQEHGNQKLYEILAEKMPETAARLHPNDLKRIIRALEVYEESGQEISRDKISDNTLEYDAVVVGLTMERPVLYERINRRVDEMIENGLADEVDRILKMGVPRYCPAMQGIGYKEIAEYLAGESGFSDAVQKIKLATRRFAKRQMTWYRKMPYVEWVNIEEGQSQDEILEKVYKLLARKFPIEYNSYWNRCNNDRENNKNKITIINNNNNSCNSQNL